MKVKQLQPLLLINLVSESGNGLSMVTIRLQAKVLHSDLLPKSVLFCLFFNVVGTSLTQLGPEVTKPLQ